MAGPLPLISQSSRLLVGARRLDDDLAVNDVLLELFKLVGQAVRKLILEIMERGKYL